MSAPDAHAGLPDIEVVASVTADEVQAKERPRTSLGVTGDGAHRSDASRRENLPDRLEPETVYRDVRLHLRVEGRLPGWGRD